MIQDIEQKRPTTGEKDVLLHHDSASPHKATIVKHYLEELELQVLPHPPYSSDLAPCDFWLLPSLKERLAEMKFYRVQDLAKTVFSELRSIPKEDYAAAMEKWIARLRTCILLSTLNWCSCFQLKMFKSLLASVQQCHSRRSRTSTVGLG